MNDGCTHPHCWAPEMPCNMGADARNECRYWRKAKAKDKANTDDGGILLPWTGNSLGTIDTHFIAGRSQPFVVGVIGLHNAGKTSALTALYLMLGRGERLPERVFAGSYTLGGWEQLAYWLRWQPGQPPRFPPHTSSADGRAPGLLHLAFRDKVERVHDILFTDAPGEWFERWAVNENAADAAGARWVSSYADTFVLFADSEALAGSDRGEARIQLQLLARRLSSTIAHRRVAIVWSKADISVPDTLRLSLQEQFERLFPGSRTFHITLHRAGMSDESLLDPFMSLIQWLFEPRISAHFAPLDLSLHDISNAHQFSVAFRPSRQEGRNVDSPKPGAVQARATPVAHAAWSWSET